MIKRLLVANRGEIAVRIMATASVLGIETVAVYPADDAACGHVSRADAAVQLPGTGAAAYLDVDAIVAAATSTGCDTLHPGYGFASERPQLAARCAEAGVRFAGPAPGTLALFGDKGAARARARELGVPVLPGTDRDTSLEEARALLREHGAVMVKAIAGGGGRGVRPVTRAADLAGAMRRCASEAAAAFGDSRVYVEQLLTGARHVEVQVIGDGTGAVAVLGDRDCSLQRRRQKLVEIAPAPIGDAVRARLSEAALALTGSARYAGLATVEFLVQDDTIAFAEVNPRLQVEHTVTEQVTGLDLVRARAACRRRRHAACPGAACPGAGRASADRPGARRRDPGPGQRRDPAARRDVRTRHRHAEPVPAPGGARRACRHRRLPGLHRQPALRLAAGQGDHRRRHARGGGPPGAAGAGRVRHRRGAHQRGPAAGAAAGGAAGARARRVRGGLGRRPRGRTRRGQPDLRRARGRRSGATTAPVATAPVPPAAVSPEVAVPPGHAAVRAPLAGTVVSVTAAPGNPVAPGDELLVIEAMKMEHEVRAQAAGLVHEVPVTAGATVQAGAVLVVLEESADDVAGPARPATSPWITSARISRRCGSGTGSGSTRAGRR